MLEKMIVKAEKLSVLFYEENDEESSQGLSMSSYPNCIFFIKILCNNEKLKKTSSKLLRNN
jgi:hypothetical protein